MKKSKIELTSFSITPEIEVQNSENESKSNKYLPSSPSPPPPPPPPQLLQSDTEDLSSEKHGLKSNTIVEVIETKQKANFRDDLPSIFLLFLLYILQGIPLGIMQTIPFLLQSRKIPYTEQAQFSLAWWPFSLKVIYAPIVDAFYIKKLGRRKSWLIPLQYLIAIFLIILTFQIETLLDNLQVTLITAAFFILNFLCATQDITVDGWALTMLRPENVGYAATCNAVGQALGAVMGYSGFLALNSASFANTYIRTIPTPHGLVTLPQFLFFWAIIFILTTTGILIFKKEEKELPQIAEQHMDIVASYKNLWKILKLRNIQYLIIFLCTVKIGTAATDAMARLKIVEKGVPKEVVAFFSIPLIPVKLILPIIISKYIVGSNAMGVYINAVPFNLIFGLIFPIVILWTPSFQLLSGEYPTMYYTLLFFVFALHLIPTYTMFVSAMAFAAKVSDPAIGGTYMTLINTITNIGGMWTTTVALWLVDYVPIYVTACTGVIHNLFVTNVKNQTTNLSIWLNGTEMGQNETLTYNTFESENNTTALFLEDKACVVKIDGYYVESLVCVTIGFLWLTWGRPTILRLQKMPSASWKVFK